MTVVTHIETAVVEKVHNSLKTFMDEYIYPNEDIYREQVNMATDRHAPLPLMTELRQKAKAQGLWNLFFSNSELGSGFNNFQYAPLAETMGRVMWAPEVFNCHPPESGNMELLHHFANEQQKCDWLLPLAAGEIRSAVAMTEPQVASSDATNVETDIRIDGNDYVINGRKWFISGAMHAECQLLIVMGKTAPNHESPHQQQSQILVPMNTPGVEIVRPLKVIGYDDAPLGRAELSFTNVRVPTSNIILGEGRGFEIAQGRLGPGRLHHCMRLIGCAQRALEEMIQRAERRVAFGMKLSEQGSVREDIAKSACEIEQARQLTMLAAQRLDEVGAKGARDIIAMIKIVAPSMAQTVLDRAIQVHGAGGLTEDFFLAEAFTYARWCRIADGPDQVHMASLAKQYIKKYA